MIASCGCRVKSYRAKEADGKWFCPGCYSEYVNRVSFYKCTHQIGGFWYVGMQWKIDGKIINFTVKDTTREAAEARALARLPDWLKEKFQND